MEQILGVSREEADPSNHSVESAANDGKISNSIIRFPGGHGKRM